MFPCHEAESSPVSALCFPSVEGIISENVRTGSRASIVHLSRSLTVCANRQERYDGRRLRRRVHSHRVVDRVREVRQNPFQIVITYL
jgi:hypothetical protein